MRALGRAALNLSCAMLLTIACKSDVSGPTPLTAPTGVTVTLVSLTSVRIDWVANPANESVRSYNVLRNGVKVGESAAPGFVDNGLLELQTYQYTVSANGNGSAVSAPSAITPQSTFTLLDLTGPRALSAVPTSGATGVAITSPITVTFSEPLLPTTVNSGSIALRVTSSNVLISGTVTYAAGATTVTFTPSAALVASTGYTLSVTTAVKDVNGNTLLAPFTTAFTTAAPIDDTPPTIIGVTPVNGSLDVVTSAVVNVTFSEDMNPLSISGSTFTLKTTAGGTSVPAAVSFSVATRTATLTPATALANSTSYTIGVTTAVRDLAGNGLAAALSSTFSTAPPVDNTPPTVTVVTPADGATGVAVSSTIRLTFSEAMNASTITGSSVRLTRTNDGAPVGATVVIDAGTNQATLTPLAELSTGTSYTVLVATSVKDLAGNLLASAFSSRFTTIPPDLTPPVVQSTQPLNNAVNIDPSSVVSATFNEAMNPATMTASTLTMRGTVSGTAVAGSVSYNVATRTITFLPDFRLAGSTAYVATISTGARDVAGNALAANVSIAFTTAVVIDNVAPRVMSTSPLNNAVTAEVTGNITVAFSEPMDVSTIGDNTFIVRATNTGVRVAGTVQYSTSNDLAQFVPANPLTFLTQYTVVLTPGIRDRAGNSLGDFTFQFTTKAPPFAVTSVSPQDRSSNVDASAPISVTFTDPINPASITASTFFVRNRNTAALHSGSISYNPATRTATFTPTTPYANANGYTLTVTPGVTDTQGRSLGNAFVSCFTPGPGTGTAVSMTGFWSGDTACSEVHWHLRLVQSGTTLSLGTSAVSPPPLLNCSNTAGECQLSALDNNGLIALGGSGVVLVSTVSGTVSGNAVNFTIVTANGLTFNFAGRFASAPGSPNAWLIGTISGATLPAVGISFENQRP